MLKSSSNYLQSSSSNGYGHSPKDFGASSTTSTLSPMIAAPLDVQRIMSGGASSSDDNAVVMVKLTDEMFAALEYSQKHGKSIRIRVDQQGGIIEIGDGAASSATNNTFRFQKQNLPDLTDTLVQTGGIVRNVGAYKKKYQIQATDKSFDETRKRAEKRAEVEKSRGTKEIKKNTPSNSRFMSSSNSTPRNLGSTLGGSGANSSRVSPSFVGSMKASTSQLSNGKGVTNGVPPVPKADMLKPELMKKSLRKRIIHLVVTQKYNDWEEVYKKLQNDGLPDDKNDAMRIKECVMEVSEVTPKKTLILRQSLLSEVDPRWMFFNQDEKAHARKLIAAQNGTRNGSSMDNSFAPMRKTGMERMTASSRTNQSSVTATNEEKKVETVKSVETTPSPPVKRTTPDSDDDYPTPVPQGIKRKAHTASSNVVAPSSQSSHSISSHSTSIQSHVPPPSDSSFSVPPEKRSRRHNSNSPPEDPPQQMDIHSKITSVALSALPRSEQILGNNGGGSTASSRLSSPASSLSSPSQPSCDWEKLYGEIKSLHDAENYLSIFHNDYPIYMECYRKLTEVVHEFRRLETKLNSAAQRRRDSTMSTKEVASIEREIQSRYSYYEKDPEFMRARQKHTDLRSKLAILKSRISRWENMQQRY